MKMNSTEKIIIIDADVVSHFIEAREILTLPTIFPFKIYVLDKVMRELERWKERHTTVENLINMKLLSAMAFPENDEQIRKEYLYIKDRLFKGDGESACLAVARHQHNVLASNNLRDTKNYCIMHKVAYLTTMDFLCYALQNGIMDEARCDAFITRVLQQKGKLPVASMKDFTCSTNWEERLHLNH